MTAKTLSRPRSGKMKRSASQQRALQPIGGSARRASGRTRFPWTRWGASPAATARAATRTTRVAGASARSWSMTVSTPGGRSSSAGSWRSTTGAPPRRTTGCKACTTTRSPSPSPTGVPPAWSTRSSGGRQSGSRRRRSWPFRPARSSPRSVGTWTGRPSSSARSCGTTTSTPPVLAAATRSRLISLLPRLRAATPGCCSTRRSTRSWFAWSTSWCCGSTRSRTSGGRGSWSRRGSATQTAAGVSFAGCRRARSGPTRTRRRQPAVRSRSCWAWAAARCTSTTGGSATSSRRSLSRRPSPASGPCTGRRSCAAGCRPRRRPGACPRARPGPPRTRGTTSSTSSGGRSARPWRPGSSSGPRAPRRSPASWRRRSACRRRGWQSSWRPAAWTSPALARASARA
mmetsp:Transcript_16283/g.47616  ORF Transcript_16283/g.47616 Transcript_16283/m.47616 type:complete len:401 (+) Transcript_16283:863-2065(+)